MNLSQYLKNMLFVSFSTSFSVTPLAYFLKYVLRSDTKICEKTLQKSKFSNIGIDSCIMKFFGV